ncbi:MAG TPA: hypothetical protein VG013_39840 [Gemmataceae bacterium]|nr:hypothetical protein [Gemmataceae bacterium]
MKKVLLIVAILFGLGFTSMIGSAAAGGGIGSKHKTKKHKIKKHKTKKHKISKHKIKKHKINKQKIKKHKIKKHKIKKHKMKMKTKDDGGSDEGGSDGGSDGGGSDGGSDAGSDGGFQLDPSEPENASPDDGEPALPPTFQTERYLRVANPTSKSVRLHVRYRTHVSPTDWAWMPVGGEKEMTFDIGAGQTVDLSDDDGLISGSRARIWAEAASQTLVDYKNQDLWLVPEVDSDGKHRYEADDMETFTFKISG